MPHVAAQSYQQVDRRQRRAAWRAIALWLLPLLLFAAALRGQWPWAVQAFLGVLLVLGAFQQVGEILRLRDYRGRIAARGRGDG